jgi:putative RecB family exonuclease
LNLSYSKLRIYRQCPLRYRFTYLDRLPRRPRRLFRAGKRVHHALMTWLVYARDGRPSLEAAMRTYDNAWGAEMAGDPSAARDYQEGREILYAFHEFNKDLPCAPAYLEHKFEISVGGHVVTGAIDRVELTERGYEVIDYKMDREPRTRREVEEDLQLRIYDLALRDGQGVTPESLSLYFVRHNSKQTVAAHSREETAGLQRWIAETGDAISAGTDWSPQPGEWCSGCDFRAYCPAVTEDPLPVPRRAPRRQGTLPRTADPVDEALADETEGQLALELHS